ncbi:MAG: O-methyltransferase [Phycisphaerales bacterium]
MPADQPSNVAAWAEVDEFLRQALSGRSDIERYSSDALAASRAAGLPDIAVTPSQGKMLMLLARACRCRHVLEVGTLGGYSTLWFAEAVGVNGKVVTLEVDHEHARIAAENFARTGYGGRIDLRVGPALETLPQLAREVGAGKGAPFDLTFIDADKASTAEYLRWAVRLSRPGAVIVIDNAVRGGAVADERNRDASVAGIRQALHVIASEPGLTASALQTVGAKGHDGFIMAVVEG